MLISKDVFIQKIGLNRRDISLQELQDIQEQFGISIDALMYKAKELNIITESRYKTFRIKKSQAPQFKEAVEEKQKNEKLYSKLGTTIGLAIVIILA